MGQVRSFWRDLFRRRALDRELDEEIRYHLEQEIERYVAEGHSRQEARRRARAEFGAVAAIKEEVRETRATHRIESLWLDARYGARGLRRNPLFSLAAAVTLALTIGAVTTVLTVAHAFFLRPLPVEDAERLIEVRATRDDGAPTGLVSYPDYAAFRDHSETLEDLAAAYLSAPLFVTTDDQVLSITGAVVTANFFSLLGLEPATGRFFRPEEDEVPGRDPVIVLSHELWRSRFGADPGAVGDQFAINGVTFTVVGVAPEDFHGVGTTAPQLYMPAMMLPVGYRWCSVLDDADCTILRMFGRLAPGVGIEVARDEMEALVPERWHDAPPGDKVACGLLFGIPPALAAARVGGAAGTLRRSASSVSAGTRVGRWLIGAQAAGAVAFVVIAALLVSSATTMLEGTNYDPEGIALLRLRPRLAGYEPERAQRFVRDAVEQLEALPEVESVTMVGTGVW